MTEPRGVDPRHRRSSWIDGIRNRARLVTVCLLALLFVFAGALTPLALSAMRASNAADSRWGPARLHALSLLTAFVDQETGERGYIITARESYLEPYAAARITSSRVLAELDREVTDAERPLVAAVHTAYTSWLEAATREIDAVRRNDPERARDLVSSGVGRARFDLLRARQTALVGVVDAELRHALHTSQRANRAFLAALVAVVVFGVAVVAIGWQLLRRSISAGRHAHDLEQLQSDERQRFIETLQAAVLPALDDRDLPVRLATRYQPASSTLEMGGDWYDVFRVTDGRVGLVVGDVVGRGIRAAAAMSQVRSALHAIALHCDDPAEVFDRLDEFAGTYPDAFCTTAFYAIYDPSDNTLAYCNAGHPPALLVDAGGARYLAGAKRPPIGVSPGPAGHRAERIEINGTARLVVYTDGLIERRGENIDRGLERLAVAVLGHASSSLEDLASAVVESMVGTDRSDDTALLAVELQGKRPVIYLGVDAGDSESVRTTGA